MSDCFILLAAGKGKRFGSKSLKQFYLLKNKPMFMHSVEKAIKSRLFKQILIVSNTNIKPFKNNKVKIIRGGKERYQSSKKLSNLLKTKNLKTFLFMMLLDQIFRLIFYINLNSI